jgi:primase-polymerase (primpol)-like protein
MVLSDSGVEVQKLENTTQFKNRATWKVNNGLRFSKEGHTVSIEPVSLPGLFWNSENTVTPVSTTSQEEKASFVMSQVGIVDNKSKPFKKRMYPRQDL